MRRGAAARAADHQYDNYTQASNTVSNNITYIARLNPSDGSIRQGQFILTRLSNGKGNTIVPLPFWASLSPEGACQPGS